MLNASSTMALAIGANEIVSLASSGASVAGTLTAGKMILKEYSDPSYFSVWGDGASAPNYALVGKRDGSETYLGAGTKVSLTIGGTEKLVATSAGVKISSLAGTGTRMVTAAADGTLGATAWANNGPWLPLAGGTVTGATAFRGELSSGTAGIGTSPISVSYAWFGYASRSAGASGAEGFFHTASGGVFLGATRGKTVDILVGGVMRASATSAGFGVAGELTASTEVRSPILRTNGTLQLSGLGITGATSTIPSGYSRVELSTSGTSVLPEPVAGQMLVVVRNSSAPASFYVKPNSGHTISYTDIGGTARVMSNGATKGLNVGADGGAIMLLGTSSTSWAVIGAWPQGS